MLSANSTSTANKNENLSVSIERNNFEEQYARNQPAQLKPHVDYLGENYNYNSSSKQYLPPRLTKSTPAPGDDDETSVASDISSIVDVSHFEI